MILFTGFPGFLGSELLPRTLAAAARRGGPIPETVCLVQPRFAALARQRLADIEARHPSLAGRVQLLEGDITRADLGLGAGRDRLLPRVTQVYHLAAVYDLAVARDLATRVNGEGTRNVLAFAEACSALERFHYASTCYVSGRYRGVFRESQLEEGQAFNNFYEETKHRAEVLVREHMSRGLPAVIYRPAIVVGDSRTGSTEKYDGPYHTIRWLLRQPRVALMPLPAGARGTELNVVPCDFVLDAIAYLAARGDSVGQTFHLADPQPLKIAHMMAVLGKVTGRRVVTLPVPLGIARAALRIAFVARIAPIPASMLDYAVHPARYDTAGATRALEGSGIVCPPFAGYAARLADFVRAHPDVRSAAMV
jgi:thioester reductase-like protein